MIQHVLGLFCESAPWRISLASAYSQGASHSVAEQDPLIAHGSCSSDIHVMRSWLSFAYDTVDTVLL